jgi:hypothetical protein
MLKAVHACYILFICSIIAPACMLKTLPYYYLDFMLTQ